MSAASGKTWQMEVRSVHCHQRLASEKGVYKQVYQTNSTHRTAYHKLHLHKTVPIQKLYLVGSDFLLFSVMYVRLFVSYSSKGQRKEQE